MKAILRLLATAILLTLATGICLVDTNSGRANYDSAGLEFGAQPRDSTLLAAKHP